MIPVISDFARKWFPILFLSLLAALSYWLENKVRLSELSEESKSGHVPDVIVENLSATKLGMDGKPHQSLLAKELLHYSDDNSTRLEEPHLLLVAPGKADVHVYSSWAQLSDNGEDIYLHDKVRLKRDASGGRSQMDVTTDYLHMNPNKHVGETDRPVRIKDANMDIHAVGMAFNDETRVVTLLSHVRGSYEK
ncbi:MAG: LPS export ABC transporter periplasmic protein LptC [Burkholderiales bacterium]|nr:LPS export ABC transporter periplasmic protein LptC [Burkholderiales bacterium]